MISYISGNIIHKDLKYVVVLTSSGLGYKVFTTVEVMNTIKEGSDQVFWIHSVVREDAFDLYGFVDRSTIEFFELLLTISGIGPKSALGILSTASVSSLKEAVITGETAYITKVAGIGKKVAEKIVLELKGKVTNIGDETFTQNSDVDAIEALKSLGYTHKESKEVLEGISKDIKDSGEKVKAALRILGK